MGDSINSFVTQSAASLPQTAGVSRDWKTASLPFTLTSARQIDGPETHKSALIFLAALVLFYVLAVLLLIGCGQGAV